MLPAYYCSGSSGASLCLRSGLVFTAVSCAPVSVPSVTRAATLRVAAAGSNLASPCYPRHRQGGRRSGQFATRTNTDSSAFFGSSSPSLAVAQLVGESRRVATNAAAGAALRGVESARAAVLPRLSAFH